MGKVYSRSVVDIALPKEDYVSEMIRVYKNEICEVFDNYNGSAYYEPSYVVARDYNEGGFWDRLHLYPLRYLFRFVIIFCTYI